MDIEGIERHRYNFKIFCQFLKQEKIYLPIKRQIFINRNLLPNDFFEKIDREYPISFSGSFDSYLTDRIDKRWAIIFFYVPYLGGFWGEGELRRFTTERMIEISNGWKEFLFIHNYDDIKYKR